MSSPFKSTLLLLLCGNLASAQSFEWFAHVTETYYDSEGELIGDKEPPYYDVGGLSGDGKIIVGTKTAPKDNATGSTWPEDYNITGYKWENGEFTDLPMQFAHYISSDGTIILGENGTGLNPGDRTPVRMENGIVVPAVMGETVTLGEGRSATLQPNGIWKAAGEEKHNGNSIYVVTDVSEDKKTFVGYTGYFDDLGHHRRVAKVWTSAGEKTLPPLPEPWTWWTEAHSVSADGKVIAGTAWWRQGYQQEEIEGGVANPGYEWQEFQTAFIWTEKDNSIRELRDVIIEKIPMWDFTNTIDTVVDISDNGNVFTGHGLEGYLFSLSGNSKEIIVNSTTDRGRKAGAEGCETGQTIANGDPECTLRSAIEAVNAGVGNEIKFAIPGTAIPTITLTKALPTITKTVKIDGTTQAAKLVEIKGGGLNIIGLDITAGNSEVRGLVMNGFSGPDGGCIRLKDGNKNTIAGNFFGSNAAGTTSVSTIAGLGILSDENTIGGSKTEDRNIFGSEFGVVVRGSKNLITGNRIGVGSDGKLLEVKRAIGIASGNGNIIGGSGAAQNLIAGKGFEIVTVLEASINGLTIVGNRIGLDEAGTTPHTERGISIALSNKDAFTLSNVTIENNMIAGGSPEIWLSNGITGATITGNKIGLAFDDSGQLPTVSADNKIQGIRLDNAPDTTISGNIVVGKTYNVLISGQRQFEETPEEITFRLPGNELDPEPAGTPSANAIIDNNTIGIIDNTKPSGVDQKIGISVFGKAQTTTISNNTIAGHNDDEIWLKDGDGHIVTGNHIGTSNGTDFGSVDGIDLTDANQVTIGSEDPAGRNIIGRNSRFGIRVKGKAEGTKILGNHIGTNATATMAWPNAVGILIQTNNSEDHPKATVIMDNVVGGNTEQGIYIETDAKTTLQGNFIGRSVNGVKLPNQTGVKIVQGETTLTGNQIANNTQRGIDVESDDPVSISKGGIYDNGDGMAAAGIHYDTPPLDPPNGLVIVRSIFLNDNGKHNLWLGLPSRDGGGMMTLEIFGNDQKQEDLPQGKVFLHQETIDTSKPFTKKLELSPNASFITTKSFSATLTEEKSTSEFSTQHKNFPVIEAGVFPLEVNVPNGTIGMIMGPSKIFSLEEAPLPNGPWTRSIQGRSETITRRDERLGMDFEFEVWIVQLSQDEGQYWRATLDWEKLLGQPVQP